MKKIPKDIAEAANECGLPPVHLVRHAGEGNIVLSTQARDWPIAGAHGDDSEPISGTVELLADDLRDQFNHVEFTIRRVRQDGREYKLDPPQHLQIGALFINDPDALAAFRDQLEHEREAERGIEQEAGSKVESLAFLDPEHPHYSSELAAAVGVWDALFEQGEYRNDQAPKQQIDDWLKRQYPDLSEQMRDHITGVVNPHRKGGAPTRNS